jgi:hypothetical protein
VGPGHLGGEGAHRLGVAVLGTVFLSAVGLTGARHALLVAAGLVVLTAIGAAIMVNGVRRRSGDVQSVEADSVLSD